MLIEDGAERLRAATVQDYGHSGFTGTQADFH